METSRGPLILLVLFVLLNVTSCSDGPTMSWSSPPVDHEALSLVNAESGLADAVTPFPMSTSSAELTALWVPTPQPLRPATPFSTNLYPPPQATKAQEEMSITAVPESAFGYTPTMEAIGTSIEGREIQVYRFGTGDTHVILVGGLHGGYEWNTAVLAYSVVDYFLQRPEDVPAGISVHIIPNANPDGLYVVTGLEGRFGPGDVNLDTVRGRFNSRGIDLNRNWDCRWAPTGIWREQVVPAGEAPFSEPESIALRDYFLSIGPELVVFWHSAVGAVYPSGCPEPHPRSYELAGIYAESADYPVFPTFDHYALTGDAGDWLTTQGIASIAVELKTHEGPDWDQNLAGVLAVLQYLSAGGGVDETDSRLWIR